MIGTAVPAPVNTAEAALVYSQFDDAVLVWNAVTLLWNRVVPPKRQALTITIPPNTFQQYVHYQAVPANSLNGVVSVGAHLVAIDPIADPAENDWRRNWVINAELVYSAPNVISGYRIFLNFPDYEVGPVNVVAFFN